MGTGHWNEGWGFEVVPLAIVFLASLLRFDG